MRACIRGVATCSHHRCEGIRGDGHGLLIGFETAVIREVWKHDLDCSTWDGARCDCQTTNKQDSNQELESTEDTEELADRIRGNELGASTRIQEEVEFRRFGIESEAKMKKSEDDTVDQIRRAWKIGPRMSR
jgi:hypothetical protein